jgi:hypothetical protein
MTDQELRALVRDAVVRHMSRSAPAPSAPVPALLQQAPGVHASHAMYLIVNTTDACVIEPSVTCNHCGYCKSHGH